MNAEPLYTAAEVAHLFRVQPTTVNRWAKDGKLHPVPTPGGQNRFRRAEVHALLSGETDDM